MGAEFRKPCQGISPIFQPLSWVPGLTACSLIGDVKALCTTPAASAQPFHLHSSPGAINSPACCRKSPEALSDLGRSSKSMCGDIPTTSKHSSYSWTLEHSGRWEHRLQMISGCFRTGGGQVCGRSATEEGKLQAQQQAPKCCAVTGTSLGMLCGCKMSLKREMRGWQFQLENSCISSSRFSVFSNSPMRIPPPSTCPGIMPLLWVPRDHLPLVLLVNQYLKWGPWWIEFCSENCRGAFLVFTGSSPVQEKELVKIQSQRKWYLLWVSGECFPKMLHLILPLFTISMTSLEMKDYLIFPTHVPWILLHASSPLTCPSAF